MSGRQWIQNQVTALNNRPLLEILDLTVGFRTEEGTIVSITDNVSLEIYSGEFYGLAGESGCGKTITALSILKLLPVPSIKILSGKILLQGTDLLELTPKELYKIRGKNIGMIFQEPSAAFNPLHSIRQQLNEVFIYHEYDGQPEDRITELLKRVGFPDPNRILDTYPHELSGGMLQRVGICLALLLKPELIIADEPTTALDVTVQAQIMELIRELQQEENTAILFINHNLNLIAQYADRISVMYAGRIVESADVKSFFKRPLHPYSSGLLKALPNIKKAGFDLSPIPGQVPNPVDFVNGCRFFDRCNHSHSVCHEKPPVFYVENNHTVNCFLYKEK